MAKRARKKAKPSFLSDIEEDEIVGGGIPDDDGMVWLNRPGKTPAKQPKKNLTRSKDRTPSKPARRLK